jgi:transcriptional regulator with XRE-family HTH domain
MKDQILKILSHYGFSATFFAEKIGVQRSSISHILSGRNKPSYDFIISIIDKYPELNTYWLLTGKGNMFIESNQKQALNELPADSVKDFKKEENLAPNNQSNYSKEVMSLVDISKQVKDVTKVNIINTVLLLYTDGTFEKFSKND